VTIISDLLSQLFLYADNQLVAGKHYSSAPSKTPVSLADEEGFAK